jgi:hypothetical protein
VSLLVTPQVSQCAIQSPFRNCSGSDFKAFLQSKHDSGGTTFPFAKKQHYNIITTQDGTYLSNKVRMETYHFGLLPLGKEVKAIATSCLRTVTFCAYLNVVGIVLFCLARLSD